MTLPFDPRAGLIHVPTRLWGPTGPGIALMALDTGATHTVVDLEVATFLGFDLAQATDQVRLQTGSGHIDAYRITLDRVRALEKERTSFSIYCYRLPPETAVDGFLGLDFLRGGRLTIDFRTGLVILE